MKRCPRCEETKSPDNFAKNKLNKDGLQTYCRSCVSTKRKPGAARAIKAMRGTAQPANGMAALEPHVRRLIRAATALGIELIVVDCKQGEFELHYTRSETHQVEGDGA